MELIDFTNEIKQGKIFVGPNQKKKILIVYQNDSYLIKSSRYEVNKNRKGITQSFNNPLAEFLGCQIAKSINLVPVQDTLLGFYKFGKDKRFVVACKVFTNNNIQLISFNSLQKKIDKESQELNDIINTINKQNIYNKKQFIEYFWNLFIINAFLNNHDFVDENWGLLKNKNSKEITLAPMFDCESSFLPIMENEEIKEILLDNNKINYFSFQFFVLSDLLINNKKINYFNFISSLSNEDCNQALKRVALNIDMEKINNIINNLPNITQLQKNFLITILQRRKELLIDFPYISLTKQF